jgi:transposase-like protein
VISSTGLPPARPKEQRERAIALFEKGERSFVIARELSIPDSSVRSWRKIWRKKGGKEVEIVPPTEGVEADLPDTLQEAAEEYESNMRRASVIVSRRIAQMEPDAIVSRADRIKQIDSTARKALRIESEKPLSVIQLAVLCQPVRPSKKDDGRLRSTRNPAVLLEAESAD